MSCPDLTVVGGCADKPAQPTEAAADIAIPLNVGYAQPLLPDIYPSAPEVVRYDRYRLVDISPSQAQRYPLEQIVHLRIPASVSRQSGMRYIMPCVIPDIVCARPMDRRTTFIVCRYPLFIIRWDRSA